MALSDGCILSDIGIIRIKPKFHRFVSCIQMYSNDYVMVAAHTTNKNVRNPSFDNSQTKRLLYFL